MSDLVPQDQADEAAQIDKADPQDAVVDVPKAQESLYVLPEIPWVLDNDPESLTSRRWASMQKKRDAAWRKTVAEYRANPRNLYWAYWLINNHPVFYTFTEDWPHESSLISGDGFRTGLRFEVSLADMRSWGINAVETAVRTEIHVTGWPPFPRTGRMYNLDGVAHGLDQAVIEAAGLVVARFGFDRRQLDAGLTAIRPWVEDA